MPLKWMEKPEIDIGLTRSQYVDLVEQMLPMKNGSWVTFYTRLAEKMSAAIGRATTPWTWRYMQGVHRGTIQPSRDFARAVGLLLAEIDGLPAQIGRLERVDVYAEPGTVQHGSIIMAGSRVCARPGCSRVFVPNVPWRKLCPMCSRGGRP